MQSVYEAAGGSDGMLRLAEAWHARVMADEVVSHAFRHGFHPQHGERLAAYWAEALGGPTVYSDTYGDETYVVRIHSGNGEHDEMDRGRSPVSTRRCRTSGWPGPTRSGRSCTTTSPGRPPRPWRNITSRPTTYPMVCAYPAGPGTGCSAEPRSAGCKQQQIGGQAPGSGSIVGAMSQNEIWDVDAAQRYDTPGAGMFAPGVLGPVVERLAALADGGRALEFAIGTGRVAVPLAERGVPVHGIELSTPMIDQLRTKADESMIPVTVGDMATAVAPGAYTLVYLVFNTISNLLTQAEQVACFRNAARHLGAGGRFVIELWVPELRRLPPGVPATVGQVEPGYIGLDTYDVLQQHVVSHHFHFDDIPAGAAVPHAAPLHLAGRTRSDGTVGRIRAGEQARGLDRSASSPRTRAPHVSVYRLNP